MEGRIKKLFHIKKGHKDEGHSDQRGMERCSLDGGTELRQSLYENTEPGVSPEVGTRPRRGNSTSVPPGRRSLSFLPGRRESKGGVFMDGNTPPELPVQDFAAIDIEDRNSASSHSPIPFRYTSHTSNAINPNSMINGVANPAINAFASDRGPYSNGPMVDGRSDVSPAKLRIPRKSVGSAAERPRSVVDESNFSLVPSEYYHAPKPQWPLAAASPTTQGAHTNTIHGSNDLMINLHQQLQVKGAEGPGSHIPTAEEIMARSEHNTKSTEVSEVIVPAVIHETVNRDVHHVREEVITREIHNYDVYHRIQPIIDIEVLPTRHFLPVHGGGLVEVGPDEVPGRSRNWVIAETISKIPTGEVAHQISDNFTARQFVGDEGDFKSYMTPEGFMRTETTWVHPPQLETGGRDTGQTWPMEFSEGDSNIQDTSTRH